MPFIPGTAYSDWLCIFTAWTLKIDEHRQPICTWLHYCLCLCGPGLWFSQQNSSHNEARKFTKNLWQAVCTGALLFSFFRTYSMVCKINLWLRLRLSCNLHVLYATATQAAHHDVFLASQQAQTNWWHHKKFQMFTPHGEWKENVDILFCFSVLFIMSKKAPKSAQYDATVSVPYRKPGLDPSTDLAPANNGKKSNSHSNSHSHGNSNSNKKGQKSTATLAVSSSSHGPTANSSGDNNPFAKVFSLSDSVAEWPVTEPVGQNSAPAEETATKTSSRTKFVPLFSAYGEDLQIKLQGRHPCQCMCTRHSLVNNCIHCGRIVCEQEGSGPCLTCGILVCTLEEAAVLRKGGLDAEKTMYAFKFYNVLNWVV